MCYKRLLCCICGHLYLFSIVKSDISSCSFFFFKKKGETSHRTYSYFNVQKKQKECMMSRFLGKFEIMGSNPKYINEMQDPPTGNAIKPYTNEELESNGTVFIRVDDRTKACLACGSHVSTVIDGTRRLFVWREDAMVAQDPIVMPVAWIEFVSIELVRPDGQEYARPNYLSLYDNDKTSDAYFVMHCSERNSDHGRQIVADMSRIGDGLFKNNDSSNMYDNLRVNTLVLSGLCPKLEALFAPFIRDRYGNNMNTLIREYLIPSNMTSLAFRLYIYVLMSGGRFPRPLPDRAVWELLKANAAYFKNAWIEDMCRTIICASVNKHTVYHRLAESKTHGKVWLQDVCYKYIKDNYREEHMTVSFVTKTRPDFFLSFLVDQDLDPLMRFNSALAFIMSASAYHLEYVHSVDPSIDIKSAQDAMLTHVLMHSACNDCVDSIPWKSVPYERLLSVSESNDSACKLCSFWVALSKELSERKKV